MKLDAFDWLAINWGLFGIFNFDLVTLLLVPAGSSINVMARIVYGIFGLAGAYMIYLLMKLKRS
jgi:uncharacterized membrane protein YuzA (DUF378 family)